MEQIAIEKKNQKKLTRKTKKLKKRMEAGEVKIIEEKPQRKKVETDDKNKRAAIYIGRLPHGFYEEELKSYFSQFGIVTRVLLVRSERNGKSRGFGFVEFLCSDVAKAAAEAMNNYLMFNRILKCSYIPPEKCHKYLFRRRVTELNYPAKYYRAKDMERKNREETEVECEKRKRKTKNKIEKLKAMLQEHGIKYKPKIAKNSPKMQKLKKKSS